MSDTSRIGRFRSFVAAYPPRAALGDAWSEHRPHVAFATALFVLGLFVGGALAVAGVNLLELFVEFVGENPFEDIEEEDLTARFFIVNNSRPFLFSILGAASLGLFTAFIMVFNGVIVGNIGVIVGRSAGVDFFLVGVLPHGIFELPSLFIAAGVGFRLFHRFVQRILGRRDAFVSRRYLYRTAVLVVAAWLMLALAAVIEAHVTPVLLDALFAERLGELETAANESGERVVAELVALVR